MKKTPYCQILTFSNIVNVSLVTNLLIPRQGLHVVVGLAAVARCHGLAGVVQVPYEDLAVRRA